MVSTEDNRKQMVRKVMPYAAMVLLQVCYAAMYVILMVTLKKGMSQSVMFVYRSLAAAVVMVPLTLWFERALHIAYKQLKTLSPGNVRLFLNTIPHVQVSIFLVLVTWNGRPKMTLIIFIKVMALGILQPVLDQNFYYMGAKATSASFASALENINPAITFAICLLLRIEKLNIKQRHGVAKVVGALLAVIGAILMILYKGPFMKFPWSNGKESHSTKAEANDESNLKWIKGTSMVLVSSFSWSSFLILQTNTLKSYPAELSLTVMICSIGAVTNVVVAVVVEHGSFRPWILGWDMRLLAVIYSGVICTAFLYFVLGLVMKEKGPVFASAFNPLTMIMTNILGAIFLAESTTLGMIIGAVIIVAGMYFILWGKSKDHLILFENEENIGGSTLSIVIDNNNEDGSTLRSGSIQMEIQKAEEENASQKY